MNKPFACSHPVLLQRSHCVDNFDCGNEALNSYLKKHAFNNNQNSSSRTYAAIKDKLVVGYFTLSLGSVSKQEAPERVGKGLGNYPIPIFLIARLAVDKTMHGKGIGKGLLQHALLKIVFVANKVGGRAVVVHAKDEKAKSFYEHFYFMPFPANPQHLYILLKDVENALKK